MSETAHIPEAWQESQAEPVAEAKPSWLATNLMALDEIGRVLWDIITALAKAVLVLVLIALAVLVILGVIELSMSKSYPAVVTNLLLLAIFAILCAVFHRSKK